MSPVQFPELPTNIAVTYPDRSPGDTEHQEHHDSIGQAFADINAAGGAATGDDIAALGSAPVTSVNGETGAVVLPENVTRLVHDGTAYPARPAGATYVEWIGPTAPAGATGDTWVDTSGV